MRVVCIDKNSDPLAIPASKEDQIFEGEIYTVTRYSEYSLNNISKVERYPVYTLAERSPNVGYAVERFIPLSDIDETEMIREPVKEIVNN